MRLSYNMAIMAGSAEVPIEVPIIDEGFVPTISRLKAKDVDADFAASVIASAAAIRNVNQGRAAGDVVVEFRQTSSGSSRVVFAPRS